MYIKSESIDLSHILYDYHKPITKLTKIYCLVNLKISFEKFNFSLYLKFSSSLSMITT